MDRMAAEALKGFAQKAFGCVGVPDEDAKSIRRIQAAGVNPRPTVRVERERTAMALVNGDNGMGHVVMKFAARLAIEKARAAGCAWVGVRWSNHAGPASLYASMPMREGMIGMYFAVGNANHLPPWGGVEMLLSTNPIAVAIPAGEEPPIVLDMASTVAAFGKVKTKAQRGEPMPQGWMVDREGRPLTDPKRMNEGFLLPIGGYKGYGLALVFGILAGTLNGAAMGREVIDFNANDASPTNTGQAILALDIAAFDDLAEFRRRIDALSRDIRGSERMKGHARIFLPGEQSRARREERSRLGVPVPPALVAALSQLGDNLGIGKLA
jgi:L-2-hydroxycarboxylate dehydrogenase (NAD+)